MLLIYKRLYTTYRQLCDNFYKFQICSFIFKPNIKGVGVYPASCLNEHFDI